MFVFMLKIITCYCSMVAAFGSGAMFSLVSGMGGPNQAANVISSGLFFALIQGGIFQVSNWRKESIISRAIKVLDMFFFFCVCVCVFHSMESNSCLPGIHPPRIMY